MSKNKNITFEEALTALENCVSKLELGDLTLDKSLDEFEEAVRLVKLCGEKLENAKQRVRILTEANDGSITDAPFVEEDET
jgi:exodeoxyribonuclease VII small subunit